MRQGSPPRRSRAIGNRPRGCPAGPTTSGSGGPLKFPPSGPCMPGVRSPLRPGRAATREALDRGGFMGVGVRVAVCLGAAGAVLACPLAGGRRWDEDGADRGAGGVAPEGVPEPRAPTSTTFFPHGSRRSTSATRCGSCPAGFHTVRLPGDGRQARWRSSARRAEGRRRERRRRPALLVQRPGPSWLQPGARASPAVRQDASATTAPSGVESGLPLADKPKPMTVKLHQAPASTRTSATCIPA